MSNYKEESELLKQLSLPRKQKKYSYNDELAGKVLFYMLLMIDVIRESQFLIREANFLHDQTSKKDLLNIQTKFRDKIKEINYVFIVNHEKLQNLLHIIVKVREQQIFQKIKAQEYISEERNLDQIKHFFIMKQFYMKIVRIRNFISYNERKILQIISIHQNLQTNCSFIRVNLQPIQENPKQIAGLEKKIIGIRRYLESSWIRSKGKGRRQSLQQLRRLAELVDRRQISNHTLLGIWSGIMLSMLTTIIFLFINYDINFTSEPQFQKTFPIWRGMCYFILLLWVYATMSYIFENNGISFRMLTILKDFYIPKYPQLFACAAFFTTLHMFMFMLYMLALAEFGIAFPNNFQLHYLPAISWLCFILFFFVPIPIFHYKKRLYPVFMILRSLFSPILGTQFKFHWWTEMWVSFRQPFRDILFTVNYYFIDSTIVYENTIIYETIAGVFLYSLRIIQNIRQMRQNKICGGMPFFGSIKCFLNIITITISYLFRVESSDLSDTLIAFWIISACISTSYAYHFDLKYDWGLLKISTRTNAEHKIQNKYLRKDLILGPPKLYYSIIVFNLLFRFIWVLNISPDILRVIPVERYILILVVSSLQILRRGIWAIFRIQNEHIIAENYYRNIGILKDNQKAGNQNMLVEMSDLSKTFCQANEVAMQEIYAQCEEEIMEPPNTVHKEKSQQKIQEMVKEKTANKQDLMEMLIGEIKVVHQNLRNLGEQVRLFVEQFNYLEYMNTSSEIMSERSFFNL